MEVSVKILKPPYKFLDTRLDHCGVRLLVRPSRVRSEITGDLESLCQPKGRGLTCCAISRTCIRALLPMLVVDSRPMWYIVQLHIKYYISTLYWWSRLSLGHIKRATQYLATRIVLLDYYRLRPTC